MISRFTIDPFELRRHRPLIDGRLLRELFVASTSAWRSEAAPKRKSLRLE
jgi:hypothetical protein